MGGPINPYHGLDWIQNIAAKVPEPMSELDVLEIRDFRKSLLSLAIPVMLQSLLSAAVNYADVLMLSFINQDAMSAVSQANQVTFLLTLFYLGLSTGVTILSAQYWGRKQIRAIEQTLGLALKLSLVVSFLFTVASILFPGWLIRLYTPDAVLISYGIPYLRIVGASYLAMGLSQMMLSAIKSIEKTLVSSVISSVSLLSNILLNGVSIFILFPNDPERAIMGVAAATFAARVLEAAWCLSWMLYKSAVKPRLQFVQHSEAWLKKDFKNCIWQVQLNYLIWGGALSATTALIGYVSSDMVSAYAVVNSVRNMAIVACTGVSAAGGILLGKYLGAGRLSLAREAGNRLRLWSLLLGAASGILILLIRPLIIPMVALNADASRLLSQMLLICAYYCIGKSYNSTLVGGIFCSGGDTRFGLICDTVGMWFVILPAAWVCAFWLKLDPIIVFFVLSLDEFVKMPFVAAHFRKYKWLKNLTRNTLKEEIENDNA